MMQVSNDFHSSEQGNPHFDPIGSDPVLFFLNPEYFQASQPTASAPLCLAKDPPSSASSLTHRVQQVAQQICPQGKSDSSSKASAFEEIASSEQGKTKEIVLPELNANSHTLETPSPRKRKITDDQWEKIAHLFSAENSGRSKLFQLVALERARKMLNRFLQMDRNKLKNEEGHARRVRGKWARAGIFEKIDRLLPELELGKIWNCLIPRTCPLQRKPLPVRFKGLSESQWLKVEGLFSKEKFKSLGLSFTKRSRIYLNRMLDYLLNEKTWSMVEDQSQAKYRMSSWKRRGILFEVSKLLPELGLEKVLLRSSHKKEG